MDRLPRIKKTAAQIAKRAKNPANKKAAKNIQKDIDHETGEIKRGEWVKVSKMKGKKGK